MWLWLWLPSSSSTYDGDLGPSLPVLDRNPFYIPVGCELLPHIWDFLEGNTGWATENVYIPWSLSKYLLVLQRHDQPCQLLRRKVRKHEDIYFQRHRELLPTCGSGDGCRRQG